MTSISFVPNINTLLDQQVGQRVTHISLITRDTQRPVTNVSYGTEEFHKRVLFFKFCIIYALYVCVCVCVCVGGGGVVNASSLHSGSHFMILLRNNLLKV